MTTPALHPLQGRLLAAATVLALKRHGGEALMLDADDRLCAWRMIRIGDIAICERPADQCLPRRIDAYRVEGGERFKLDPKAKLFSLQYQHLSNPPAFDLVLLQSPALWFDMVAALLLSELRHHDPQLLDGMNRDG
jgi:hypothetical protein